MTQTLAELQRFAVPGQLAIDAGCGGLLRVGIATPLGRGEVYLHGAHVSAWQPAGHAPVLWMSSQSLYADGKPLRGGIPLCWPWFGPASEAGKPAHGLVRQQPWTLEDARIAADGTANLVLRLNTAGCDLRLSVGFGRRLGVELAATNAGSAAIAIGEALHAYLAVGDARRVTIRGLEGVDGSDRVAEPRPVRFAAPLTVVAETDLLFTGTTADVLIEDPALGRTLRIGKSGSRSTVVWNPWIAKSARMPDFGDHEWPGMLCVESANAGVDAYQLAPGATHRLGATIEVL